jgi:hypothetical protein
MLAVRLIKNNQKFHGVQKMSKANNSKINSNTQSSSECLQNDSVKIKRYSLNEKFTIISNESMEDPNISFAAKGLLSYILTRPTDWCVYVNQLASIYSGDKRGNGRDAIYSMINELKERGYVRFIRERNDKGQWNCWYEVYAVPQDFKIIFPQPVKSGVVKPNEVKPDIITSNECTKKLRTTTTPTPPSKVEPPIEEKKVVVVASNSEIYEDAENLAFQCNHISEMRGEKWKISKLKFMTILRHYTKEFICDALNYMLEQEKQAELDEKSSKFKKTPRIDKPYIYLQRCLKENWCLSEDAKFKIKVEDK